MSPFGRKRPLEPTTIKHKSPSPRRDDREFGFAQGRLSRAGETHFPKGMSPPVSFCRTRRNGCFWARKISASMTVEAAVVLPLFLFFFIQLGCAMEMIRLHGNLQLALWEVGNRLSVYGYALGQGEGEGKGRLPAEISDLAFSYTYIKGQVTAYVGESYLEHAPLAGGADGLQFWESRRDASGDTFRILVSYRVSPWLQEPKAAPFWMANKYYGHIWNGYDLGKASGGGDPLADWVYVAQNGAVYHQDRNCSHLALSIRAVNAAQIEGERNADGGRYSACEKCVRGSAAGQTVFVAEDGDRYHSSRQCSGLRRTVFAMTRREAQVKYRPCSRCGG